MQLRARLASEEQPRDAVCRTEWRSDRVDVCAAATRRYVRVGAAPRCSKAETSATLGGHESATAAPFGPPRGGGISYRVQGANLNKQK